MSSWVACFLGPGRLLGEEKHINSLTQAWILPAAVVTCPARCVYWYNNNGMSATEQLITLLRFESYSTGKNFNPNQQSITGEQLIDPRLETVIVILLNDHAIHLPSK